MLVICDYSSSILNIKFDQLYFDVAHEEFALKEINTW